MPNLLGLDIGYGNVKQASGDLNELWSCTAQPAGAGLKSDMDEEISGEALKEGVEVRIDDQIWVAGVEPTRFATPQRELHEDYTKTKTYRALGSYGIYASGMTAIDMLVTGLPSELYRDKQRRKEVKQALKGKHRFSGREVEVKDVKVMRQPLGAFVESSISGVDQDILKQGDIAIADVGFYSFDWSLISRGAVKGGAAGTNLSAMSQMIEAVQSLISESHGGTPSVESIEQALRKENQTILLFGDKIDLSAYMEKAKKKVSDRAVNLMRQSFRDLPPIDLFVLTGGGASLYKEALEDAFPKSRVYVSNDPVTANARGFLGIGREAMVAAK